jgi:hypothetical protein
MLKVMSPTSALFVILCTQWRVLEELQEFLSHLLLPFLIGCFYYLYKAKNQSAPYYHLFSIM